MTDTVRTLAALQALLHDNAVKDITPQKLRDFLVSAALKNDLIWPGMGMGLFSTGDNGATRHANFGAWVDALLLAGFTQIRLDVPSYYDDAAIALSLGSVDIAVTAGAKVIWGVASDADHLLTHTIWHAASTGYAAKVLAAAASAQSHGVYEFLIGNEEELHNDPGFTDADVRTHLLELATTVQGTFTNGNVSYSMNEDSVDAWVTITKAGIAGKIDLLGINCYRGVSGAFGSNWKTITTNLINEFGAEHTYVSELGPSALGLADYSADEAVQATALAEMIAYIKSLGITRAFYFDYYGDARQYGPPEDFGVLKTNGTYRQLWDVLKKSGLY
jgi:hypothetical protein